LWLWAGWEKLSEFKRSAVTPKVSVTVVVPVRNEEKHIGQFLMDILSQNYPAGLLHIFIMNDHSNDRSVAIIENFAKQHSIISLRHLPEGRQGKKAAIGAALPFIKSDLVVTADADCRLSPEWLSNIAEYYEIYRPAMIIGPVFITGGKRFFDKWQALEMMSLIGSSAGAASRNRPIMCSGAHLVMERNIMERYAYIYNSNIASGDDMMMLIEIKKETAGRIAYLKSKAAIVETAPQPDWSSFLKQRVRWTSKSSKYSDKSIITVAVIVFLANLSIVTCFIAGLFSTGYLWLAGFLWLLKTLIDFPFLYSLASFWNRKKLMRIFLPAQLLYPFYIVFTAFAGNILPVNWKGRKTRH
jgi:cellulose synthase/poly-beta-1,6-N-acetylglucosamine synthase-like glycosyltransferase